MILKLNNLSRSFGSLKAVDGIELEVARGEALFDPSSHSAPSTENVTTICAQERSRLDNR